MKKTKITLAAWAIIAAGVTVLLVVRHDKTPAPSLGGPVVQQSSGRFHGSSQEYAGFGWSVHPDTKTAIEQAVAAAEGGTIREPDITIVFYTTQHNPDLVVKSLQGIRGSTAKVFGWSSNYGVVVPDGYHISEQGAIGLLSLRIPGMKVGVGCASLDEANSPADCAKLALRRAIENIGNPTPTGNPSMILMSAAYDGQEENYLQALSAETGGVTPILGGTAGGTPAHGKGDSSFVANDKALRKGLVLSVFYSTEQFAWSFRGGFDRTGKKGVITASEGRLIQKIDGRPALEVYDEWSGGRVGEALREGKKNMNTFCGLYPICRTVNSGSISHNLYVHAWPTVESAKSWSIVTSANLWKGDEVHFAEGSWNILINRMGQLPQLAKEGRPNMAVTAGLLVCCEGVLKNIPPDQRDQIATLINRNMGDVPWIGMFTWGEQGNFTGVGNYHGNLLTSFTLFPGADEVAMNQK